MNPPRRHSGFSIVTAIFLLVILSMLGAFMLTISNAMHVSSAQDIQGSRAFRAARAGIEWGVARVNGATACYAPPPIPLALEGFEGFAVAVTCTMRSYDEGGTTRYIFWLESTASAGGAVGSLGYVERTVNAFVEFW